MSRIKKITFSPITRPLRTVFATSLGRKDTMRSMIVKVLLDDGRCAAGEVPTSLAYPHETIAVVRQVLEAVAPEFVGLPIDRYEEKIGPLRKRYPATLMTLSGLELALFRAGLAAARKTEHRFWGGKLRRIETDITVPFLPDPALLRPWLAWAVRNRFTTYKIKVSGTIDDDLRVLSFVHAFLADHRDDFALRLDGNQGFTRDSYFELLDRLDQRGIALQLFEQPLPRNDFAGLKHVKKRSPVPVILDETVFNAEDLQRVIQDDLGHGINIKFAKSGIQETRKMIPLARQHNLKLMIGCMTETFVGLSAAIYCAAGTGAFDYVDLDGIFFLFHRNRFDRLRVAPPEFLL